MRRMVLFVLGFAAGALSLYYVLWRTGGLTPRHFLTLTTREIEHPAELTPRPIPAVPLSASVMAAAPSLAATAAAPTVPTPAITPLRTPSLEGFSLIGPPVVLPVEGARRSDLRDSFEEKRGSHRHEAIDILAPRGTSVVAAVDGVIAKLFTSKQGGLTVYEFDRDGTYCYYYAHLDRYAESLREGETVQRGDRIGYVGTTGDAPPETPHLHFAVTRLGPEKRWWEGVAVNPYPMLLAVAPPK